MFHGQHLATKGQSCPFMPSSGNATVIPAHPAKDILFCPLAQGANYITFWFRVPPLSLIQPLNIRQSPPHEKCSIPERVGTQYQSRLFIF